MSSLLRFTLNEWTNGWTYDIDGYMGNESGICTTFSQAIRKVESYQRRAYKEYMKDNPTAKIAK